MRIDWWTLGLQALNVGVLLWILAHFLFRPVARIIAERQAAAQAVLGEAEALKAKAEEARAAAEAEAAEAAKGRAALTAKAVDEAEAERRRLIAEAQKAAEATRKAAQAELEGWKANAARALSDQAGTLATDIAARLLSRLPESARVEAFIDGLASAVAELPEATRAGIGAGGPVPLRAARDLTADERSRLSARLAEVLGREVALDISTDPTLIAGLELDAPHAIVRNHFRADLDRIRAELTHHD